MPTHFIPQQITIVSRPEYTGQQLYSGRAFQIRPAFVVPSTSTKMVDTARNWARQGSRVNETINEVTCANTPMRNLQVFCLERRFMGGATYKVITDAGFCVDLHEPEFMEALLTGQIGKDGFITGEYVWSVDDNQMRLVRVGSTVYNDLLKAGATAVTSGRNRVKTLRSVDLAIGNEYDTALSGKVCYAGRVRRVSDRKLCFAWYVLLPSQNPLSKGGRTKNMVVSASSLALKDLGPSQMSLTNVPLINIYDGFGQRLGRDNFVWQGGAKIR